MPALLSKLVAPTQRLPTIWQIWKRYGHARNLTIDQNRTTWLRLKDHTHFYLFLAVLIYGGFVTVVTTLYGQCQLVDTPEGYEPRYWQYERHPVNQLLTKWYGANHAYQYELRLGALDSYARSQIWIREEERARRLMFERQDYKAWYYIPYYTRWLEWSRHENDAWARTVPEFMFHRGG